MAKIILLTIFVTFNFYTLFMHSYKTKPVLLLTIFLSICLNITAQESFSQYHNNSFNHFDRYVYLSQKRFHTAVKPFLISQTDSLVAIDTLFKKNVSNKFFDIVFNRNLVKIKQNDFYITIDPLFNFELGKGSGTGYTGTSWVNTRGFLVKGSIGKKVAFSTSFYENQAMFNDMRRDRVKNLKVVPGQGSPKIYKTTGYDYAFVDAYASYSPSKFFNFQLGHGKNFIGDGYRSLILSDNSLSYPFFKLTTNVWNLKYWLLFAQFQDLTTRYNYGTPYDKKWGVFHFIDYAITPWLNVGLFESVIWQNADSTNHRGFDFNYINPIAFFRPVEFSVGSPDNVLMGGNGRLRVFKKHTFYGQFVIDEFNLTEIKADIKHMFNKSDTSLQWGFWSNKFAIQAGYKTYNLFIDKLDVQTEVNFVRPFMYAHLNTLKNYANYNQPLAHPLGSNFVEWVSFLKYNYNRVFFEARYSYAVHGSDTAGLNFGNNIFKPYTIRANDYGNTLGQAQKVNLQYLSATLSYLVNPATNLNIYISYTNRKQQSGVNTTNQNLLLFGVRTSLQNFYFDF